MFDASLRSSLTVLTVESLLKVISEITISGALVVKLFTFVYPEVFCNVDPLRPEVKSDKAPSNFALFVAKSILKLLTSVRDLRLWSWAGDALVLILNVILSLVPKVERGDPSSNSVPVPSTTALTFPVVFEAIFFNLEKSVVPIFDSVNWTSLAPETIFSLPLFDCVFISAMESFNL